MLQMGADMSPKCSLDEVVNMIRKNMESVYLLRPSIPRKSGIRERGVAKIKESQAPQKCLKK